MNENFCWAYWYSPNDESSYHRCHEDEEHSTPHKCCCGAMTDEATPPRTISHVNVQIIRERREQLAEVWRVFWISFWRVTYAWLVIVIVVWLAYWLVAIAMAGLR